MPGDLVVTTFDVNRRFMNLLSLTAIILAACVTMATASERHTRALVTFTAEQFAGQPIDDEVNLAIRKMSEAGGGTIELGPGEYTIGEQILLIDHVLLRGAGREGENATILKLTDNAPSILRRAGIVRIKNDYRRGAGRIVDSAAVEDLIIDGNRHNQRQDVYDEEKKYGLYAEGRDLRVSRVTIRNCMGYGFDPHANDLLGFRTERMIIEDSHAYGNLKDGFTLDGQVGMIFRRNLSEDNDRAGINIVTSTTFTVIEDNVARNNTGDGIVVQNGSGQLTIRNNEVYGNKKHGIVMRDTYDNRVTGNDVWENHGAGIRIRGGTNVLISDNTLRHNVADPTSGHFEIMLGRYKDAQAVDNIVSRNRIVSNRNGAMIERDGANRNAFIDNVYTTNGQGIVIIGQESYGDNNIRAAH